MNIKRHFHYFKTLLVLILCWLCGRLINHLMPFQLSSGIYGMIIFFGLLHFEIIKPLEAGYTCALIMKFMAIPFIPISVGFLEYLEIIEHHFFSLIVACILSTLFVLVVTAITAEKLVSKL